MIRFSAAQPYVCQRTVSLCEAEDHYCGWVPEPVISHWTHSGFAAA